MNNKTYLSEEHIVAYLDGEVALAGKEVRAELAADRKLAQAALDYHGLQKAFTVSAHDSRFQLTAETDRKTVKALREALRTNRGEVRLPQRAADAAPVRPIRTAAPLIKQMWFKRTSIGLAFAMLLGALFFSLPRNEIKVEPSVAEKEPAASAPLASNMPSAQENVAIPNTSEKASPASEKHTSPGAMRTPQKSVQPTAVKSGEAPILQNVAQAAQKETANPQDIMISRRYAKMIKDTRIVEITEHDKM